jgi:hypothetical protein
MNPDRLRRFGFIVYSTAHAGHADIFQFKVIIDAMA